MRLIHESPHAYATGSGNIAEIWDYTLEHSNVDQAEVYFRKIKAAIEAVADEPRRGRPCDEVRAGCRKYPAGSHLLFYRTTPDGIDMCAFCINAWTSSII